MKKESSDTKAITLITYIYLTLPFLIFVIGWVRAYIALPVTAIVVLCGWKAWRETPGFWRPEINLDSTVKILFIAAVLGIWVFWSGIGKFVWQNWDHQYRNAIFQVLVDYEWPVYDLNAIDGNFSKGATVSLIYYIGFWMPAAVVGKLFGLSAGYGFQAVWALLGVILTYYYLCARKRKLLVWPVALLIFFSGLDILGYLSTGIGISTITNDAHLEWWIGPYQYSSMTTQLFWVFNQAIPAWLATIFSMEQKNNRSLIFILGTIELTSTFPFVGLIPYIAFWMLSRLYGYPLEENQGKHWDLRFKLWLKDTVTIQNLAGGGVIGILSFLYLGGNAAATGMTSQSMISFIRGIPWIRYFAFIIFEVGVYLVLVYKYNKRKPIYFVTAALLLLIPLTNENSGNFCMRASIPALFILLILVQDTIEQAYERGDKPILAGIVVALCIGSVTPVHEQIRTLHMTMAFEDSGNSYNETVAFEEIFNWANFSGSVEDNFFFEHIAKVID